MSDSFEPVYYVSEHGKVQRINTGSRLPIPTAATPSLADNKRERNIYVVIPKDVEVSHIPIHICYTQNYKYRINKRKLSILCTLPKVNYFRLYIYCVLLPGSQDSIKARVERMSRVPIKQSNSNNSFNIHDHKGHSAQGSSSFTKAQARNTMNLKIWC